MSNDFNLLIQTETNEWYTPSFLIQLCREVMGSIDLDPASSAIAQRNVKASKYYTKQDDGFHRPWFGNVFLNPPYGKKSHENYGASEWMLRCLKDYKRREIKQATIIVRGDSRGMKRLIEEFPFAEPTVRINFTDFTGQPSKSGVPGTKVIYLGNQQNRFARLFEQSGKFHCFQRYPLTGVL
jgi:DNA N-6-adenine-methyltransferase (Dam)